MRSSVQFFRGLCFTDSTSVQASWCATGRTRPRNHDASLPLDDNSFTSRDPCTYVTLSFLLASCLHQASFSFLCHLVFAVPIIERGHQSTENHANVSRLCLRICVDKYKSECLATTSADISLASQSNLRLLFSLLLLVSKLKQFMAVSA